MRHKIISLLVLLLPAAAHSEEYKQPVFGGIACRISFKNGKADFEEKEVIERCFEKITFDMIDHITIMGSSSINGSKELNQELSAKRANAVADSIKNKISENIPMTIEAIGADPYWVRSVVVKIMLKKSEPITITKEVHTRESKDVGFSTNVSAGALMSLGELITPFTVGLDVSVSKIVYSLSNRFFFYPIFSFDYIQENQEKNNTRKRIFFTDYGVRAGVQYNWTKYVNPFFELGAAYGMRSIAKSDISTGELFIYNDSSFLLANNIGFIVAKNPTRNQGLFGKLEFRHTIGLEDKDAPVNLVRWAPAAIVSLGWSF